MYNAYESFKKYQVTDVTTVAEFLDKYYKPERYTGRGEEYANILLNSYTERMHNNGFVTISHFDSITGRDVSFYPPDK